MEKNDIITKRLIDDIINLEWTMFSNVNSSAPNSCQENEKTFRLMRWMSYSVMPEELLTEIFDNIYKASLENRNLMMLKYARMDEQIPRLTENPLIDECVVLEEKMMKHLKQIYPLTFSNNNDGFGNYLKCELETYSEKAIELYYRFLSEADKHNRNVIKARYDNLFKKLGYISIEEKEMEEKKKMAEI